MSRRLVALSRRGAMTLPVPTRDRSRWGSKLRPSSTTPTGRRAMRNGSGRWGEKVAVAMRTKCNYCSKRGGVGLCHRQFSQDGQTCFVASSESSVNISPSLCAPLDSLRLHRLTRMSTDLKIASCRSAHLWESAGLRGSASTKQPHWRLRQSAKSADICTARTGAA